MNCSLDGKQQFVCIYLLVALTGCANSLRSESQVQSARSNSRLEERPTQRVVHRSNTLQVSRNKKSETREESKSPVKTLLPRSTAVELPKSGDHYLYTKVWQTYRQSDTQQMGKTVKLLLKAYPNSVFADNALYLAGLLALRQGNLELAEAYMTRLLRLYPYGNKVAAALFARGVIEKRHGRAREARSHFKKVQRLYPGSPEAIRVTSELKTLGSKSTQSKTGFRRGES